MIEHGTASSPQIVDLNNDGLQDLIVSNFYAYKATNMKESRLAYYQNTGSLTSPKFTLVDVNFLNLERNEIRNSFTKSHSDLKRLQQKETIKRYQFINDTLKIGLTIDSTNATDLRSKLDKVLTHKIFGYAIFFAILLLIFQSIFDWSSVPMDMWRVSIFGTLIPICVPQFLQN